HSYSPSSILRPSPPTSPSLPYTTLFRSDRVTVGGLPVGPLGDHPEHFRSGFVGGQEPHPVDLLTVVVLHTVEVARAVEPPLHARSEEHTSELQSRENLVCRLLLEKKKRN